MTVTLNAFGGPPTIAPGDTVTIAAATVRDASGQVDAGSTPRAVVGSFGIGGQPTGVIPILSGIAGAGQRSSISSDLGTHTVTVPVEAAVGDLLIEVETAPTAPTVLPAGTPVASSPFLVRATFSATGLQPVALAAPLEFVVAAPAAEIGATPVSGLIAFMLKGGVWVQLPTWVDRDDSLLHIAVPGNQTVAIAAVTPRTITLRAGWNLIPFIGAPDTPTGYLFAGMDVEVDAIHRWAAALGRFESAFPLAPSQDPLRTVQPGDALWIHLRGEAAVEWATYGGPLLSMPQQLHPGWNLVSWVGAETPFTQGAATLFGRAIAIYRWDWETGTYQVFNAGGPAFLNTLITLYPFDGLWVYASAELPFHWIQPGLPVGAP